jgi:hypothetical protein
MNKLLSQFNTGILIKPPEPTDYIRGVNSPLSAEKINLSGDWSPYIPTFEDQFDYKNKYDTMNCTGFSLTNVIEMWLDFYIQTGRMLVGHMQFLQDNGYLDANGKVNLSERALGVMAGTGANGNYLQTVVQAARTYGLAPDSAWAWDHNKQVTIAEYYSPLPDAVWQIAAKFRDLFEIQYHWLNSGVNSIAEALQESPLWVALCTCPGWNNPPVQWCGVTDANHAVSLIKDDLKDNPVILDHYTPYIKQLALNYGIPWLMQVFVVIKDTSMITLEKTLDGTIYLNLNGKASIGIADMNAESIFAAAGITPSDVKAVPAQSHTLASGIILHKVEQK